MQSLATSWPNEIHNKLPNKLQLITILHLALKLLLILPKQTLLHPQEFLNQLPPKLLLLQLPLSRPLPQLRRAQSFLAVETNRWRQQPGLTQNPS